jgi:hypothetical protein
MIVFVEYGRLGNQAFQFLALRLFFDERIIFIGFSSLRNLLSHSSFDSVNFIPLESVLVKSIVAKAIKILARLRIITIYRSLYTADRFELNKQIGILRWPKFVDTSDFQHPTVSLQIKPGRIALKNSLQKQASLRISLLHSQNQNRPVVFVHIRRGDYVRWPTVESPAVLPSEWYFCAMEQMQQKVDNPLFAVITDDIPYAKDIFRDRHDVLIESNNEFLDVAFMANCSHGILSASSFSWLGAYLAYSRNFENDILTEQIFIAPDPWLVEQVSHIPPSLGTPWLSSLPRTS